MSVAHPTYFYTLFSLMQEALIHEIETLVGQAFNTHRDFVYLSQTICDAKHEYISPTTLKRVWGKQHDYTKCSIFTLDLLARYLGYADYKAFCQGKKQDHETSGFFVCTYSSDLLSVGDELCLKWAPDRQVVIRYEGNRHYRVVSSENAKISVNDTFECISFLDGEVMQLSNLMHKGQGPFTYVAGKMGGVHITPMVHEEITPIQNNHLTLMTNSVRV